MKALLRKLNWRLILIHFLAIWLFMGAFRLFASLYDYNFLHTLKASSKALNDLHLLYPNTNLGERLAENLMRMTLMQFVGLLGAFLISLGIALKMRWFWLNSIIVFTAGSAVFILKKAVYGELSPIYYISYIQYIFPKKSNPIWEYGATALITLILAILLLFSPLVIRFINKCAYRPFVPDHLVSKEPLEEDPEGI